MRIEISNNKDTRGRFSSDISAGSICRDIAISNGLVMRAVGDTMIIAPPLIISESQIDELIEKAIKTLDETNRHISSL